MGMNGCTGCDGPHEYEECPYREVVAELRQAGVDINTYRARQMAEAAKQSAEDA